MKKYEVLNQLNNKKISTKKAYKQLYGYQPKLRRAHFMKLKINIQDDKKTSRLLTILFIFPIALVFVKIILKMMMKKKHIYIKQLPLSTNEIIELISYKGLLVNIDAHDEANIVIKTI